MSFTPFDIFPQESISVFLALNHFPNQFLIQDTDLRWQILAPKSIYCNSQNCKTTCTKVAMKTRIFVHAQCSLHLLKARTMMDNIFLSYILLFLPKSLFSITLILICITLSLVTLLGNHFSFHFIALCCKRNVITWTFV